MQKSSIRVPVSHFVAPTLQRIDHDHSGANRGRIDLETGAGVDVRIGNMNAKIDSSGFTTFDGGGWTLPITIGGQTLTLNIDTGSSDL